MFSQKKQNMMNQKQHTLFLLIAFFCFGNLFSAVSTMSNEDALFQENVQIEDEVFDVVEEAATPVKQIPVNQEEKVVPQVIEEVPVTDIPPTIDLAEVDDQSFDESSSTVLDDAAIGAGSAAGVVGLLTAAAIAAPKVKTIVQAGKDIRDIVKGDKLSEADKKKLLDKNIQYQEKLVYTRTKDAEEKIKQYRDAGDVVNEEKWRRRLDAVLESDQYLREQKAIQEQLNRDKYVNKLTPEAKRDLTSLQIDAAKKVYDVEHRQLYGSLKNYADKDSLTKSDKLKKEKKEAAVKKIKKYDYRLTKLNEQNIKEHEKELERKERTRRIVARGARVYGR